MNKPHTEKRSDSFATRCGAAWCAVVLPAFLILLIPASASGDIYKWTDEQGGTVISNTLPENPNKVKNIERIVKENKPAAPPLPDSRRVTPTERLLLDRIDNLERRLQARAYSPPAPQPQSVAPAQYYEGGYYPPPPPPASYYSNYAPGYYPSYSYPLMPAYSYVVYPARTWVTRPAFVGGQRSSFRGGAIHRGRR